MSNTSGPYSAQIQRALQAYGFTGTGGLVLGKPGIATTSTDGLVLENPILATSGVPVQQSPRLRFRSNVWNTTATAANNTDDWWIESVPVSGTTPSGLLKFGSSLNGGAATYPMRLYSSGTAIFLGGITFGEGAVLESGLARIYTPGAALWNLERSNGATGFGFDSTVDAVAKFRTRAQTGYATVDALGYQVSGVAGANFGPAAPLSITVVNGLVTAVS